MRPRRSPALLAATVAALVVVLGAPTGLVWAALAPHPDYHQAAGGAFGAFEPTVGADACYALVCLVAGLLIGTVLRRLTVPPGTGRRSQRDEVLLAGGLLAGSVAAGLIASRVGALVRAGSLDRVLGSLLSHGAQASAVHQFAGTVAFVVHARELLAAFPLGAALGWALVLALSTPAET